MENERYGITEELMVRVEQRVEESLSDLTQRVKAYDTWHRNHSEKERERYLAEWPPKNLEGNSYAGYLLYNHLRALFNTLGYRYEEVPTIKYSSNAKGEVYIPGRRVRIKRNLSMDMKAKVTAHEAGHIFAGHRFPEPGGKAWRELIAEGTAHTVSSIYHLDTSQITIPIIHAWSRSGNVPNLLSSAIPHIRQTSVELLYGLEGASRLQFYE